MDIKLRRVNLGDLKFLFRLRNEEVVRFASFNSDPIDLETHRKWFEKKLAGNESVLFVAEENSQPIAQIRFDWLDGNAAEVNIAVIEKLRRKGYGSEILLRSSLQFIDEFPECEKICAFIKLDNLASIRSFIRAGYVFQKEADHKGQKCLEMIFFSRHY